MSKSRVVGPKPPSTMFGFRTTPDISKSVPGAYRSTVDPYSGLKTRQAGGEKMVEGYRKGAMGNVPRETAAYRRRTRQPILRKGDEARRQTLFRGSDTGQFGGTAYADQKYRDQQTLSDALMGANIGAHEYGQKRLGDVAARTGQLGKMAAVGDLSPATGGAAIQKHSPGLGSLTYGPKWPVKEKPKTTKKATVHEEGGTASGAGGTGGDLGE
mgnify:FL=1